MNAEAPAVAVLSAEAAKLPACVPSHIAREVYAGRPLTPQEFADATGGARSVYTVLTLIRARVLPTLTRRRPYLLSPSLVWDFHAGRLRL